MSFVCSFLGMNTTDIRNLNWSQALFWIVSAPITTAMLLLILILTQPRLRRLDFFKMKSILNYESLMDSKSTL
jgi:hypothetical protein